MLALDLLVGGASFCNAASVAMTLAGPCMCGMCGARSSQAQAAWPILDRTCRQHASVLDLNLPLHHHPSLTRLQADAK